MKAVIQHNILAGMGEIIGRLFEIINISESLRNIGYDNINLYINIINYGPLYFNDSTFFNFFDEKELRKYFDDIQFYYQNYTEQKSFYPNEFNNYIKNDNLTKIDSNIFYNYCIWDLFLENIKDIDKIDLTKYSYLYNKDVPYYNIFNNQIIEKYKKIKKENYVSIHYRINDDLGDYEYSYNYYENEIKNIIFNNNLVFVCSNSYKFKEYIKLFNYDNIFMYNSSIEEKYGNNYLKLLYVNEDEKIILTETALIEMLILSESDYISLFSTENRSSFHFLAKTKNVPFNLYLIPNNLKQK